MKINYSQVPASFYKCIRINNFKQTWLQQKQNCYFEHQRKISDFTHLVVRFLNLVIHYCSHFVNI